MDALLVALGAAIGAPMRFALGRLLDGRFPVGTLLINTAAALLLGLCVGWSIGGSTYALVGTGLCGGMSTYSTFAVQAHERGLRVGTAYVIATLALGLGAAALGHLLTTR